MEANDVGRSVQRQNRLHMHLRQPCHRVSQNRIVFVELGGPIQYPPQIRTQAGSIGQRQAGAGREHPLAVRLDPRGIHAIQRSATHEPDRAQG